MRTASLLACALLTGCEREPVASPDPALPAPDVERPELRARGGAPVEVDPRIDLTKPVAFEEMLPQPPSVVPARYANWLAGLTHVPRAQIDAFCAAQRRTWFRACGGIGPLHIPMPPRSVVDAGTAGIRRRDL